MQFLCMLCGKQPAQFKARKARRSDANNPAGCSCRIERWPWGASSCRHEMRLPGLSNRKLPHRYLYQCGNPIFRYCPIHTKNILTLTKKIEVSVMKKDSFPAKNRAGL